MKILIPVSYTHLIPFFFTDCTKIMHTVYQFFNILLTAQVFRIIALINLIHNAGLTKICIRDSPYPHTPV